MPLGENIKTIRKRWSMNRDEFGELMDSTGPRISQYEIKNNEPKIPFIIRLQQLTNVNTYDLYYSILPIEDIPPKPLLDRLSTNAHPEVSSTSKYDLGVKLDSLEKEIITLKEMITQLIEKQQE